MKLSTYLSAEALETLSAHPFESAAAEPASALPRETLTLAFWSDLAGLPDPSFCSEEPGHHVQIVDASHLRSLAG